MKRMCRLQHLENIPWPLYLNLEANLPVLTILCILQYTVHCSEVNPTAFSTPLSFEYAVEGQDHAFVRRLAAVVF